MITVVKMSTIPKAKKDFVVTRYIDKMAVNGDATIFGEIKYNDDEPLYTCRVDIRRDVDVNLSEVSSNPSMIYIKNVFGNIVEISVGLIEARNFRDDEHFVEGYDDATEPPEEFDYNECCSLTAEEWMIALSMVQTVL